MSDADIYEPERLFRGKLQPDVEHGALLPGQHTAYKAAGVADQDVSRLVLIMGKEGFQDDADAYIAMQYVHIGLGAFSFTAQGQRFRFLFSDLQPKLVTVHGRKILRIYDQMALRRVPWIRQADRDFQADGDGSDNEPIITRIEIEDWTPMRPAPRAAAPARAVAAELEPA